MPPFLKGKIFGMPRYLFFILLAVGIGVGIYLRRRQMAAAEADTQAEDYGATGENVGAYPTDDPGLAGVGITTQPAGAVYPVNAPYLPEGLTEIIGALTGGLVDVATRDTYLPPNAVEQQPAVQPATVPAGTGGPPDRPRRVGAVIAPRGSRISTTPGGRTRITTGAGKHKKTVFAPKGTPVKRSRGKPHKKAKR